MATFTAWLKKQAERRDPVGDFARDVQDDTTWPGGDSLARLHVYLDEQGAIEEAHDALDVAYVEWCRYGSDP